MAFTTETKYLGPTNFKGARVKARFMGDRGDVSATVSYESAEDSLGAHCQAVQALLDKVEWAKGYNFPLAAGSTSTGYVFVQAGDAEVGTPGKVTFRILGRG